MSNPGIARGEMIAERQRRSLAWRIVHLLGSLKLALLLLAVIALACAAATFAEASFDTKIAQAYIYKSPWFIVWLGMLCINLFAVTITRWPWQKKHAGFIITHYGIITLLIGSMIGLHTGFEGNVTLRKGALPVRKVVINRSILQVESPADSALYVIPFDASVARPSERRPRLFDVPGTQLRIFVDGFSDNLIKEQSLLPSDSGRPGVLLRFTSSRVKTPVTRALVLEGVAGSPSPTDAVAGAPSPRKGSEPRREDFFGLAEIVFQPTLPAAPTAVATETQMVFARFAPVVQSGTAKPSGVNVTLSEDGRKVKFLAPGGTSATYLRSEIMKKAVAVGPAMVTVEDYWPDFEIQSGRPLTKSQEANNPAALVRVQVGSTEGKPALVLAPDGAGVVYQLWRAGVPYASGSALPGDKFALGWADWEAEVLQFFPMAAVASLTHPGPPLESGAQGIPGFRARLESPGSPGADPRWIESGNVTSLTDGKNVVRIGYGLELRQIPFSLRLVDFQVPRYEGTETPANFIASVEFEDTKTGEKKSGTARMNHPASFPGTFLANLTGINYKFSQAEWNPRDTNETTLQVLYDPGWFFKWTGSLAICAGIAIMFYFRPRNERN